MELIFVDESGDDGVQASSSPFYILTGAALDDIYWKESFWKLRTFRESILKKYGLKLRTGELKGEDIFQHEGILFNSGLLPSDQRWIGESFLQLVCDELRIKIFVYVKSKRGFLLRYPNPRHNLEKLFRQEIWREYLSRYEEYLLNKSQETHFPQTAMLFYDKNQEKHVRGLVREFNIKFDEQNRFPGAGLIEDVFFYKSETSLFIQLADFLSSISLRLVQGKSKKDTFEVSSHLLEKLGAKTAFFIRE